MKDKIEREGGHHFEFTDDGKAKLLRFAEQEASLFDVEYMVEALGSLRCLLGLRRDAV